MLKKIRKINNYVNRRNLSDLSKCKEKILDNVCFERDYRNI